MNSFYVTKVNVSLDEASKNVMEFFDKLKEKYGEECYNDIMTFCSTFGEMCQLVN